MLLHFAERADGSGAAALDLAAAGAAQSAARGSCAWQWNSRRDRASPASTERGRILRARANWRLHGLLRIHFSRHQHRQVLSSRPSAPANYKYVPIGYHGRASTIVVAEHQVRRPFGQWRETGSDAVRFGATQKLDYEAELGSFIGPGNSRGEPIPTIDASSHIFGFCLLNDWSAHLTSEPGNTSHSGRFFPRISPPASLRGSSQRMPLRHFALRRSSAGRRSRPVASYLAYDEKSATRRRHINVEVLGLLATIQRTRIRARP